MNVFSGVVQKGKRRGSALGYPTINIPFADDESGVYAAVVRIAESAYHAAAFADPSRKLLEAHLLDFSGVLYGQEVSIELTHKIRDAGYFNSDDELRKTIGDDVVKVREYFNKKI